MTNAEQFPVTVLYVDDEDMARKYFVRTVGAEFDVLTAAEGDAAIDVLARETDRVGILVTDYRMPGRDGGDLLRVIARDYPHVVCILVTAYADKQVLLETINSAEVFQILEKPLDVTTVRDTLRLAVKLARDRAVRRQRLMAMNETLAFLSHELNTPLVSIVNFARGINRRIVDLGAASREIQEIEKATSAMHDNARYCIEVLTTFVRSVRKMDQMPADSNGGYAGRLVSALIGTLPLTPTQRAWIRVDVVQDFQIMALPNIVSLVLSSVMQNALRALKDSAAPMLRVTILIDANPEIRIADNGPGIGPEILARLLLDPVTMHSDDGGSGWGLILCNRIMQAFGGGILIKSELGQGTTVTLKFPIVKIEKRSDR